MSPKNVLILALLGIILVATLATDGASTPTPPPTFMRKRAHGVAKRSGQVAAANAEAADPVQIARRQLAMSKKALKRRGLDKKGIELIEEERPGELDVVEID